MNQSPLSVMSVMILLLFSLSQIAIASDETSNENPQDLLLLATGVMFVFFIFAASLLQHSRLKHRVAQQTLDQTRHALEQRVVERTDKLRNLNNKLFEEIARHESTEQQLRETREYQDKLFNSLPVAIIGIDDKGIITHCNTPAALLLKISCDEASGKQLELLAPDLMPRDLVEQAIATGQTIHWQTVSHDNTGTPMNIELYPLSINRDGRLRKYVSIWIDEADKQ